MAGAMARAGAGTGPDHQSLRFKESGRRLIARFGPERLTVYGLLACVVLSVGLSVIGPKILGRATDLVFAGIVGRDMPAGATKEQVLESMRERGEGGVADMLRSTDFTPGEGIDFTAVGNVLLFALAVFTAAGLLMAVATRLVNGAVNRTMYRMREDVQTKLSRLPLSYFDKRQRGEVLSRATNDIDNLGQTLQQTMGQLINSLLTVIGVLAMMFYVSWILALVALVTVPLSFVVATRVGKRSQPHFVRQWKTTGTLNAHIEEMYTGHTLVKVFGRQEESARRFAEENEALYEAGFRAQFNSGVMQPLMLFVSNLNYVLVAVVGGLRVASGSLSIGDVQAFIQYSRQFSMPLTQVASMANLVQSGVASAERVFELLDAEEQSADVSPAERPAELRGRVALERVSFRYDPEKPLIEDLSLTVEPGHTVAIVGPTGAGKTTLVNLLMRFYEVSGGRITLDGVDMARMSRDELRSGIGMVLQDTWLFGGTIAENIAYGASREVTREEIEEAARA
ncbi:ABC transporter ATP-binding protein, partial [Streptomyces prasinus]